MKDSIGIGAARAAEDARRAAIARHPANGRPADTAAAPARDGRGRA